VSLSCPTTYGAGSCSITPRFGEFLPGDGHAHH
jgi:hypothetical protein